MQSTPAKVFAQRLRAQRRAAGVSQAELARRLSALLGSRVVPTMITKIEGGDRAVRLDEAVFAAQALEVPLAALVSERDPVEVRLEELRREVAEQEARMAGAEREHQQAQLRIIDLQRQIEQLEPSREG